jgi:lipopolysaccharide assembly protein A
MIIFLFIGLFLGAVSVVFALQNITTVTVTFMAWKIEGSLALILLLAVATGVVIGVLISLPDVIKKSFQISRLKKHGSKLESDLVQRKIEVEAEKSKLDANNAYLDDLEKDSRKNG